MGNEVNPHGQAINFQASNAAAITPNDGANLPNTARGIFIGGDGNITVDMLDIGTNITFVGVQGGTFLPLMITKVYATGTTATSLIALY